jgi:hypothetical protein
MASSTQYQWPKIFANNVSILMENQIFTGRKVPTIATGTAIAGIKVDLKSCKNK